MSAVSALVLSSPLSALAEDVINLKGINAPGFKNIVNYKPSDIISAAINLILMTAALIAFIFLLIGGVQWIMAGGDKEGTEKARKRITAALIGLAIVFSAYAIAFIINAIFGVNIFTLEIKQIGQY